MSFQELSFINKNYVCLTKPYYYSNANFKNCTVLNYLLKKHLRNKYLF